MNDKVKAISIFISYFIKSYPKRLKRFLIFLFLRDTYTRPFFILEWVLLFFDLLGLPEIFQILHEILHWKLRSLTKREKDLAYPIFQESIKWNCIRVNGHNMITKKYHFAFVSFHSIHFHENISDHIFIHELVHVWQYEKFGSAYIVRALHAQQTKEGYDYGGELMLYEKKHLLEFNFEQMAEVIKDGYLRRGSSSIYNNYIEQLQE